MGLVKAAKNSLFGALQDQWQDYVKCDALSQDVLVQKVTGKDGKISAKSKIQVANGQVAIVYDSGKIMDVVAEPGIYEFSSSTSPSIFAGQFGESLKEVWERFKYDGVRSKEQSIYFINILEIMNNKFGSTSPMPYADPVYRSIYVRYFGKFSFRISNPIVFFQNVVGNITDSYTKTQLMEQAKSEFITELATVLSRCSGDGISFSNLPGEQKRLSQYMSEALDEQWNQNRGMSVESVAIESISVDEKTRERIEKIDDYALNADSTIAAGRLVDAQATAMVNAANNANGAATGFMGLGMMNMTANSMMGGQSPLDYVNANQANNATVVAATNMQPAVNKVKICPNCKKEVNGNFCSECGTKIEEEPKVKICPNCKKEVKGNFCSECGTKCE